MGFLIIFFRFLCYLKTEKKDTKIKKKEFFFYLRALVFFCFKEFIKKKQKNLTNLLKMQKRVGFYTSSYIVNPNINNNLNSNSNSRMQDLIMANERWKTQANEKERILTQQFNRQSPESGYAVRGIYF